MDEATLRDEDGSAEPAESDDAPGLGLAESEADEAEAQDAEPALEQDDTPDELAGIAASLVEGAGSAAQEVPVVGPRPKTALRWVFGGYLGVWLLATAGMVYAFWSPAAEGTVIWAEPVYMWAVYGGVGLAAFGPVLGLATWIATRRGERPIAFSRMLLVASAATLGGVVLWLGGLVILDAVREGWIG